MRTALTIPDRATDGTPMVDDDFFVLVNAWWEQLDFIIPPTRPGQVWHGEIDTYDPTPFSPSPYSAGAPSRSGRDPWWCGETPLASTTT